MANDESMQWHTSCRILEVGNLEELETLGIKVQLPGGITATFPLPVEETRQAAKLLFRSLVLTVTFTEVDERESTTK